MDGRLPSIKIAKCLNLSTHSVQVWFSKNGIKSGEHKGYTYEQVWLIIQNYVYKVKRKCDLGILPSDFASYIANEMSNYIDAEAVCPYCGGAMIRAKNINDCLYFYRCTNCGSQSPAAMSSETALLKARQYK